MPYCVICGKGQARLNPCNLCKSCKDINKGDIQNSVNTPENMHYSLGNITLTDKMTMANPTNHKDDNDTLDALIVIDREYNRINIERNVETISDPLDHSSNYESDSDSNLINVGVNFTTSPSLTFINPETIFNSTKCIPDVTLDINDDIPIILQTSQTYNKYDVVIDGIKDLQDFFKSSINNLYETIDFLKKELVEKNLQIQHLISGEAYVNKFDNENSLDKVSSGNSSDTVNTWIINGSVHNDSNKDEENITFAEESSIDSIHNDNNYSDSVNEIPYYADDETTRESSTSMLSSTIKTNSISLNQSQSINDQIST